MKELLSILKVSVLPCLPLKFKPLCTICARLLLSMCKIYSILVCNLVICHGWLLYLCNFRYTDRVSIQVES